LEGIGSLAASLRHVEPLVRKGTATDVKHLLVYDVADGSFHHAPSARGRKINRILRAEELLEPGLHGLVKLDEIRTTVPENRGRHGGIRLGKFRLDDKTPGPAFKETGSVHRQGFSIIGTPFPENGSVAGNG